MTLNYVGEKVYNFCNLPFDKHHRGQWMNPMSNRPITRNQIHVAGTKREEKNEMRKRI
jgi:hypothetical protein